MTDRQTYKTRQSSILIAYLKEHKGHRATIKDIEMHFARQGETLGRTTLYRRLAQLVSEGVVRRFDDGGNTASSYEYIEGCPDDLFHIRCEKCGQIFTIECPELGQVVNELQGHMKGHHGIEIDLHRSMLSGLCPQCLKTTAAVHHH